MVDLDEVLHGVEGLDENDDEEEEGDVYTFSTFCKQITFRNPDDPEGPFIPKVSFKGLLRPYFRQKLTNLRCSFFNQCWDEGSLIDFAYDMRLGKYNLEAFADDHALLEKINIGRNKVNSLVPYIVNNHLGGTTPVFVTQDTKIGQNNIKEAKAVRF